jgi:hypothetical protein
MAKHAEDAVLDGLLDVVATATIMCVCSALPATYAEMTATYDLATHVVAAGDFGKADDGTGRKLTVAAQAAITVDHTDTATNVCLGISGTTTLLYCTSCTGQLLTAANTVTVPAWVISVADAT